MSEQAEGLGQAGLIEESEPGPAERLTNGFRTRLQVGSKDELSFTVTESRLAKSSVHLVDTSTDDCKINWLQRQIVSTDGPLAQDPGVLRCLAVQQQDGK